MTRTGRIARWWSTCALVTAFTAASSLAAARDRASEEERELERVIERREMVGDAAYGFRGLVRAANAAHTPDSSVLFAAESRGMLTLVDRRLGPAIALDLELGPAPPYAFAYRLHLMPVGFGVALGARGSWITTAGVGVGGITAAQRADVELPVASRLAFDVSPRARVMLDARTLFTFDARDHNRATVGDETRVGIGARVGRAWVDYRMSDAGGYFFRLERVERLGTTYLGLTLGYELGGAF